MRGTYPNRMRCWCCGATVRLSISGLLFYYRHKAHVVHRRVCANCWRGVIGELRRQRVVAW